MSPQTSQVAGYMHVCLDSYHNQFMHESKSKKFSLTIMSNMSNVKNVNFGPNSENIKPLAKNLGVRFDNNFTL